MPMTLARSIDIDCCDRVAPTPVSPAQPLMALLTELSAVIQNLTDAQYVQKPVGVMPSSVGGHVRHCLDHVAALVEARQSNTLNYDHRQRGTPIENDREAAAAAVRAQVDALSAWHESDLAADISLSVLLTSDGQPINVGSTLGRELAYTVSHTIHHNAIIGAMVKTLGGLLPDCFGFAPATLRDAAHRKAG
ncbi:DinB family protein [Humisphaera borealis]|uniref:DinB family protein n=1 Tax=Humisphaera borealis TaxID=2807512 RepID=A0A7M2WVQ8_9BACT|nr:DinB family protein [Humisphaera borealis]QOV89546.1 DinB family protein [Humisphaera borealis]